MNQPEVLEELETRRALHERITRGKPARPFADLLEEKMRGKKRDGGGGDEGGDKDGNEDQADSAEPEQKGARDPLLGLAPNQDPSIANPGKGRRGGKVIVKG